MNKQPFPSNAGVVGIVDLDTRRDLQDIVAGRVPATEDERSIAAAAMAAGDQEQLDAPVKAALAMLAARRASAEERW